MLDKADLGLKIYKWDANSTIIQIDVRGDDVAYLHADGHINNLPAIRQQLEEKGWATSSDSRPNERAVLRVSGFGDINNLLDLLQNAKAVEGTPNITQETTVQKNTTIDNLKANSLRASGVFYLLGDVLYSLKGFLGKASHKDKGIGLSMLAGDVIFMGFGKKDDAREFRSLIKKLKTFYKQNGIEVPDSSALNVETLAAPGGFLEKTYDFIHENVNVFKCVAEAIGGGFMFSDGLEKDAQGKRDWGALGSGTLLTTGFGAAAIIKERKMDPEEYAHANPARKLWMQIKAQPLRLAAYAGLANNAFVIKSIFTNRRRERDGAPKTHWELRAAGVTAMIAANILYSISKKTTGGDIKSSAIVDDIYSLSAQILDHMDPEQREAAIKQTAHYLGQRVEIKDTREQIEANLRREINELRNNPWFRAEELAMAKAPSTSAGIDQAEAFANDPANATNRTPPAQQQSMPKPVNGNDGAMQVPPLKTMQPPIPNPALDSVTAGAASQQQPGRVS